MNQIEKDKEGQRSGKHDSGDPDGAPLLLNATTPGTSTAHNSGGLDDSDGIKVIRVRDKRPSIADGEKFLTVRMPHSNYMHASGSQNSSPNNVRPTVDPATSDKFVLGEQRDKIDTGTTAIVKPRIFIGETRTLSSYSGTMEKNADELRTIMGTVR